MTEYHDLSNAYFSGSISREDELRLFHWLRQDAQHVAMWREWEQKWVDANAYCATTTAAWRRLQSHNSHPTLTIVPVWRRPVFRWTAVACCAALVILFWFYTNPYPTASSSASPAIATTKSVRTSVVATNAIQSVMLPDSSRVVLNRGSQLSYSSDFGQADRQIMLSGEAYFEVMKDTEHPFIVSADGLKIRVTGTKFNVTAYEQITQTTVTLLEGGVLVTNPSFDADLLPNEQLVYTRESKELVKRKCEGTAAIAWMDGNMDYDYIRLEELMWRLSLMYDEAIRIEGEAIRNRHVHYYMDEQHPLEEVMDAIGEVYKLHIAHSEQGYLVRD